MGEDVAHGLTAQSSVRQGEVRRRSPGTAGGYLHSQLLGRVRKRLPSGHPLPDAVWDRRHAWVVRILAVHVVLVWCFGLAMGYDPAHALLHVLPPAALGAAACWTRLDRRARGVLAATGLMVLSGSVVHIAGGVTEAHFLFFAMVPVVALYQSWWAFGAASAYVLVQHGVVGTLASSAVYDHPAAREHPWVWAMVHSSLFALASLGTVVNWKLNENSLAAEERMRHTAYHDALTRLPNRLHFFARLEAALSESRLPEIRELPTVLLIDLDGFKPVNDRLGHHSGDAVLVQVGQRLRAAGRAEDFVARLGGDEFVILVDGSPAAAETLAARITDSLAVPIALGSECVVVGASIGIATADEARDPDALMRSADEAMYRAKASFASTTREETCDAYGDVQAEDRRGVNLTSA